MEFDFDKQLEKMMREHELQTIVVLGHINPDGDASGSVMAVAHYIHAVHPEYKVFPYLADTLDKGPKSLVVKDKIFHPFDLPEIKEAYAVIQCDTAAMSRIAGKELYDGAAVSMVIDHHASNPKYGDINYVKISEACAENVFYILDWYKWKEAVRRSEDVEKMHPCAADYVYLGIVHDTSAFSRADYSTFKAAEELLRMGVDHRKIMRTMNAATFEDERRRASLYNMVQRVWDGKVAYVMVGRKEIETLGITYEDIHPFSGILRDCEDIEMAFTMYEEELGCWRCSFRSDGKWINVNELLQHFKGGGHAGAAGVRKHTDDPCGLIDQILRKAEEMRGSESAIHTEDI